MNSNVEYGLKEAMRFNKSCKQGAWYPRL